MRWTATGEEAASSRRSRLFAALGRAVVRHPIRVILVWVALISAGYAIGAGAFFDTSSVRDDNPADALPAEYESSAAAALEQRGFPQGNDATATLVVSRRDGGELTSGDVGAVDRLAHDLTTAGIEGVEDVTTGPSGLAPNRSVQIATVRFEEPVFDESIGPAVGDLRDRTEQLLSGTGLEAGYTGGGASATDAAGEAELVATVSMAVILLLMLIIFRSPLIAIANLLLVGLVSAAAGGAIVGAAKLFDLSIDTSVEGLVPIVVLGVGTDYAIFLLFRYRERLRLGEERRQAMAHAIERVGAAVTSSAFAVVVSFSALLLSAYEGFRVLGPALAVAVLMTLLAGLTLIPAVLVLIRPRALFWPSRSHERAPRARLAGRIGGLVGRRPVGVALASAGVLAALALGAFAYAPSYDVETIPAGTESSRAFATLERGFPSGTLNPTEVFVASRDGGRVDPYSLDGLAEQLAATPGVGQVRPPEVGADGDVARIDLLLEEEPLSSAALDLVEGSVIPEAHAAAPPGTEVRVGGNTSAFADVRTVMEEDTRVIFPVAAALIGLILILMLRSLVAPLYMLGAVVLGFAATLGATVLAFQGIGGEAGLVFQLPLVVYLFVASMGGDYNILMIGRVREEIAEGASPREAAARAVRRTGPAIAAAGVILAASFGALLLDTSLAQIGFAVAVGIFLSAFVMAGLLVPALTAAIGRRAFWPARVAAGPAAASGPRPAHREGVAAQR
jgi:putative drug exporter of the RND superfamily